MHKLIVLVLALPALVFCEWDDLFERGNDHSEVHHVNVISGTVQLVYEDHVVKGAVPLPIVRYYSNRIVHLEPPVEMPLGAGWDMFPHIYFILNPEENEFVVHMNEPSGKLMTYVGIYDRKDEMELVPREPQHPGLGMMGYRGNSGNNRLHLNYGKGKAILYLANGGKRIYRGNRKGFFDKAADYIGSFTRSKQTYLLEEEVHPSGLRTIYRYSDDSKGIRMLQVSPDRAKVYAALDLQEIDKKHHSILQLATSDGKRFSYRTHFADEYRYLDQITSSMHPTQMVKYVDHKRIPACFEAIHLADRPEIRVEYYQMRKKRQTVESEKVKAIFEGGVRQAFFAYEEHSTDVRNAENILTRYHHRDGLLLLIEYFDKEDQLYSSEQFSYDQGRLTRRAMCSSDATTIFSKNYVYDEHGNVIEESIHGNSDESYSKCNSYDKNHLLIEEREESGLICRYCYLDGTDLLTHKWIAVDDEVIFEEVYEYDRDHLLVEKRVFDHRHENVERYRRDPQNGMIVEVGTGLKKTVYSYDNAQQIIEEKTDHYSISIDYDKAGHIIRKTLPLGGKNEYLYDIWGNATAIKEIGFPKKEIAYDIHYRPIQCNQDGKQSTMTYDIMGRVIVEKDYRGEATRFEYDAFGRCIKKRLANGDETQYGYDPQGNIVYEELPNGAVTRTEYNIFNKPCHIVQADGSEIWNSYYSNGDLKETIHPDHTRTNYEYDPLHRLISKRQAHLEERWEYEDILLKSYTSPDGLVTTYAYDQYGRKIEENCEGRNRKFFYDELGYPEKTMEGDLYSLQIHDVEGRVVEECKNGFNRITYTYDSEGRKSHAIKGEAVDTFFYDSEGRLVSHVNPINENTHFHYEDQSRTVIDPLGNKTIETFDCLLRMIQKEKQSADGKTVFREEFFYGKLGNIEKRLTTIFDGEISEKAIEVEFVYDVMGRLIEEMESGQKRTFYHYDIKGRLISKVCPNGISLDYQYDDLDRIIDLRSSDGTIWYEYTYEGTHLIEVKDHILEASIKRCYTKFGELAEEIGFFGHKTAWNYDSYGRVTLVTLPDHTAIGYAYSGSSMESVSRLSSQDELLYEHRYTKFDLNQHVEEEQMPWGLGVITSKRDLLERPYEMTSPYHKLELNYGPTGLVTKSTNSLVEDKEYKYDPLNQIVQENKTIYAFDSIGNPKDCEINDLNQIIVSPTETFKYDLNGNLIERIGIRYSYDALNRLKEIHYADGRKVVYTYDPFSRLVSKKDTQTKYYLYDKEYEIGIIDEDGSLSQLKVLGLGVKGDIGAAIAIELQGERFTPLHDLQGNIIGIVNASNTIIETYNFTTFGEMDFFDSINPWRFASKRHEEGLIFFGKRIYDPKLKRFLTPDPIGFTDSRNLYVYTLNSPMNRLDQFGLESEMYFPVPINGAGQFEGFCNPFPRMHPDYLMPTEWIGRGSFNGMAADIMFIAARVFDLTFTPQEIATGKFNFIDHLYELIENVDNKIALVTLQNGIYTSRERWIANGHVMSWIFPKGTLIGSVYNPTEGVISDGIRTFREKAGAETYSVKVLRSFHTCLLDILETYAPNGKALNIPHSEGGPIYNRSYEGMSKEDKGRMQRFFYCEGIGPAESIPREYGLEPKSTYSDADFFTGWFASESNEKYDVRWVEAKTPILRRIMFFADHGLVEDTYRGVLKGVAKDMNNSRGFYVGNQR